MAKDKSEKKERKEKKEKRSESEGVKKSKKEKKSKLGEDSIAAAVEEVTNEELTAPVDGDVVIKAKPQGALVPFANPLADEKVTKKVLKSVKKGTTVPPRVSSIILGNILTIHFCSGKEQNPEAGSQRSCQGAAKIAPRC
jgi:H/ACA ribonucleoprotein complex subunit 2